VKRLLVFLAGLFVSLFAIWLAGVGLVVLAGARPDLRPADAILVLGAAQYNGRPSPVLKARLDHALSLYRRGLASHLVLTGGVGAGDTLSEGEVARRYALRHDVPDSAILVDRQGATSAESIEAAASLMRQKGLASALIVSDPYHMLRLELLARVSGIEPHRAPTPTSPIARASDAQRHYVLRESLLFPATALLAGR
jgi:uncharacterized SAM-binding protein YcdF (DUF218 family)